MSPQWAAKGGHSTLGMTGPLDLVTGVFLRLIWPKNSIKALSKTLIWPEKFFGPILGFRVNQILEPEAKQKLFWALYTTLASQNSLKR